jgi:hypothetical protein
MKNPEKITKAATAAIEGASVHYRTKQESRTANAIRLILAELKVDHRVESNLRARTRTITFPGTGGSILVSLKAPDRIYDRSFREME